MVRRERRGRKNLFVPVFIITIMVLSVFGVMIGGLTQEDNNAIEYNGINFILKQGGYFFTTNGGAYSTLSSPLEVEGFSNVLSDEFWNDFKSGVYNKVYLDVSNPSAGVALNELHTNLNGKLNMGLSCSNGYEDAEQCLQLPIKSCGEPGILIITMNVQEEKESSYENGCVTVKGSLGYLTGVADNFVMNYAGVYDGN